MPSCLTERKHLVTRGSMEEQICVQNYFKFGQVIKEEM